MVTKIIVSGFFLLGIAFSVKGQTEPRRVQSGECPVEYTEVMNHLFSDGFVGWGNGFALSMRYRPPNAPEAQINIIRSSPGKFSAYLFRAKGKSILLQVQDIMEKQPAVTFADVLKQIRYEKISLSISESEILSIRDGFLRAAADNIAFQQKAQEKDTAFALYDDRSVFEAHFFSQASFTVSAQGNSVDEETPALDELPFVDWMQGVMKELLADTSGRSTRRGR